ncbi:MAG TPA: cytochrome c [Flavobacteriia bacterium]|nr:cytochrome c [Flavobacteriia bacterium]
MLTTIFSFLLFGFIGFQDDIWKAPEAAKKLKNPTNKDANSIMQGKCIFRSRCAVCHGLNGHGDGPGAKALTPKPKDLTLPLIQNQTDGELFWKISKGRNDMIQWEPILSETQRWNLVNYIRTLK